MRGVLLIGRHPDMYFNDKYFNYSVSVVVHGEYRTYHQLIHGQSRVYCPSMGGDRPEGKS